jgi:hypothetical protein
MAHLSTNNHAPEFSEQLAGRLQDKYRLARVEMTYGNMALRGHPTRQSAASCKIMHKNTDTKTRT